LPAPVFREVAGVQARRRLGLTATLVREDGLEGDVFALIGPKRFDIPWRSLEARGWIATARCVEVRIPLSDDDRVRYLQLGARERFMLASRNVGKGPVLEALMARHPNDPILILGTYIDQLEWLARRFSVPLITGKTSRAECDIWFAAFCSGACRVLALFKVGNFAVDLPNATVAIQVSGSWGSRQEEAQRLGRVLRPKEGSNQAVFYSLVSEDTREQEMAERRQLFLAEQGYPYRIEHIR
jgi:DNA excision repair protein ERCC-3